MSGFLISNLYSNSVFGTTITLITAPAGHKYLIKRVMVYKNTGTGYTLFHGTTALAGNTSVAASGESPALDNLVLEPGDTLKITTYSGSMYVDVSGADYTI